MKILVIDGQGGKLGRQLIESISRRFPQAEIIAVGTNSTAAAAMLKAGAAQAATGENPVIVASRQADIIVGPIGIVIADSLLGEVTASMANAVARSRAARVLIPVNRCDNLVAGINEQSVSELLEDALDKIGSAAKRCPN